MAEKSVSIIAVGDIFFGEHPVTLGHGVRTISRRNGCEFLFQKVRNYLKGADIVCGNLEGIISPKQNNETGVQKEIFWGEPTCAKAMQKAGINCLFLANNHTAQHGKNALERTCALLDDNNIKWTGYNASHPDTPIPAIFQLNELKVGLLAYCETQQYNLGIPLLPRIILKNIKSDVKKLKEKELCDIVVVSFHWGDEFIDYPSPCQIELAHKIIDTGVNVIIGHHSHTMQGIEHYKNGLIAYSIGSFIKDLWPRKLRESFILKCEVSPSSVKSVNLVPIIIDKKFHRPEVSQGIMREKFFARIHKLSKEIRDYSLVDSIALQKKYVRDVKNLLLHDRIETVMHYLFNIFRYDKKLLKENIKLMIKRRLGKKNI